MHARRIFGVGLASILAAQIALAAPPTVPASLPYQGLLLDGLGQPRTGSVDLVVRVWDAVVGGTLVYKQSFPSVALADGVFSVQLGPTGEGSDAPANPLTTDLATALAGDAGATAPVRFLEVTVGGDGALSRTQVLSSAYALRATSAAAADTAATAATADDVTSIDGFDAAFVSQFFTHFSADGEVPPNADPSEGVADADGDGRANFIDSDNDDDGTSDATEVANGTDINLVTPAIGIPTPSKLYYQDTATISFSGSGFQPGLSIVLGSQTLVPIGLTFTGFQAQVGPQAAGLVDLVITNPNGQSRTALDIFEFTSSFTHSITVDAHVTLAAYGGSNQVALGGLGEYGIGSHAENEIPLLSAGSGLGVAWTSAGNLAALRAKTDQDDKDVEILVDSDGDLLLSGETGIVIETIAETPGALISADLLQDGAGRWVGGYIREGTNRTAVVAHDRNGDGDFIDTNERHVIDFGIYGSTNPADLAVDSANRVAYVYLNPATGNLKSAWDRNGDGDFADNIGGVLEQRVITATGTLACLGATFDSANRLAIVYAQPGLAATLLRDLNLDGDFSDAGEAQLLGSGAADVCDVAWRPGQPFAVMHAMGELTLLLDKNDDGDFADAGESNPQGLDVTSQNGQLALDGVDRAVMAAEGRLVIAPTD